jgi:hypothetical protein
VSPEDVFDLDSKSQVMAAITQAGQELLLPNRSLGREAAQLSLRRLGIQSIAAQNQKGFA